MSKEDLSKPGKIKKSKDPRVLSQETRDLPGILKATILDMVGPLLLQLTKPKSMLALR